MPARRRRRRRGSAPPSPWFFAAVGIAVLGVIAASLAIYRWEKGKLAKLAYLQRVINITIPEGFNRYDIAERLEHYGVCPAQDFLAASQDPQVLAQLDVLGDSLEGYLFPETYQFLKRSHPSVVAKKMVDTWKLRVPPVFAAHAARLAELKAAYGWDAHHVLILASIVEKEASKPEERPVIAGVFLNRMRSATFTPKLLQADPTITYGCRHAPNVAPSCLEFTGKLGRTQRMDRTNPYNTYFVEGLPPGPISNPGIPAITSVLEPTVHDYFYFVAKGDGNHYFSRTFSEHRRAIARFLKAAPPTQARQQDPNHQPSNP